MKGTVYKAIPEKAQPYVDAVHRMLPERPSVGELVRLWSADGTRHVDLEVVEIVHDTFSGLIGVTLGVGPYQRAWDKDHFDTWIDQQMKGST